MIGQRTTMCPADVIAERNDPRAGYCWGLDETEMSDAQPRQGSVRARIGKGENRRGANLCLFTRFKRY